MPPPGPTLIAQPHAKLTPEARASVRGLSVAVAGVLLLIVAFTAILLIMRQRRRTLALIRRDKQAKSRTPSVDAWAESAKRLAINEPGADDDTVDLDGPPEPHQ